MSLLRDVWQTLKEATLDWIEDKAAVHGAALAFYGVLSLAPLLFISIAAAAFVFGEEAARGQLVVQLRDLVGAESAAAIEAMIDNSQKLEVGSVATLASLALMLFGASGMFIQLQDSLNTIWKAPPRVGPGLWGMVRDRFLSFAMVLGSGCLLLLSLVISAAIAAAGKYLGESWQIPETAFHMLSSIATFLIATLLFALIFKLLPDVRIAWRDVWLGAAITSVLFTLGKLLIAFYLGKSGIASVYGAGGSVVVLVLWLYYSAQILLFGAELTQVCARRYGSRIVPRAAQGKLQKSQPAIGT